MVLLWIEISEVEDGIPTLFCTAHAGYFAKYWSWKNLIHHLSVHLSCNQRILQFIANTTHRFFCHSPRFSLPIPPSTGQCSFQFGSHSLLGDKQIVIEYTASAFFACLHQLAKYLLLIVFQLNSTTLTHTHTHTHFYRRLYIHTCN